MSVESISSSNSYGDTVTISQEALEAYETIDAKMQKLKKDIDSGDYKWKNKLEKKYWYDDIERNYSRSTVYQFGEKIDRLNGDNLISTKNLIKNSNEDTIKWRLLAEQVDNQITTILNDNNIILSKDEILNLTINQDAKVSIGNGINEDKRLLLEELFNKNNELRSNLLTLHQSTGTESTGMLEVKNSKLLREYGLTVNDFEITTEDERASGALALKFKDKVDDEFLMKLFTDDPHTFNSIVYSLKDQQQNGKTEFEYNFSYKNGVTIEKHVGDQTGLNKRYDNILRGHLSKGFNLDNIDVSLTINSSGEIVDSTIINKITPSGTTADITDEEIKLCFQKLNNITSELLTNNSPIKNGITDLSLFTSQSQMKKYVFESQRLVRFNTGISKEESENRNLIITQSLDYNLIKNYARR
jgi:hypothetical protein